MIPNLPPQMAALVAANEAAEANEAVLAEYAAADEVAIRARMREHAEHVQIATTGHTSAEIRQAEQNKIAALAAIDYDPGAPLGDRRHPEVLIDGASVASMAERAPGTLARAASLPARRAEPGSADWIGQCLADHEAGAAEWNGPVLRRQRMISAESEAVRSRPGRRPIVRGRQRGRPREITRTAPLPSGPPPLATPPEFRALLPSGDY